MKNPAFFFSLVLSFIVITNPLAAQTKAALIVLPFTGGSVDSATKQTAVSLLRREIDRSANYRVLADNKNSLSPCSDDACAAEAGSRAGAAVVVYGGFGKLGNKILVTYYVVDVATKKQMVTGDVPAASTEDLDVAMGDVARRVVAGSDSPAPTPMKVLNRPPYVGVFGVGIGEMFVTSGFNGTDKQFVLDTRMALEYPSYSLNAIIGWRYGPMINFGATYIFTPGNFAPYFGGGVGYHIYGSDFGDEYSDPVLYSGFQVMFSGGMLLLRTNDIRVFANVDYMKDFINSSSAVVLTFGVAGTAIVHF